MSGHWSYIVLAYAAAIGGTTAMLWASWRAMRRAEAAADKLRGRRR